MVPNQRGLAPHVGESWPQCSKMAKAKRLIIEYDASSVMRLVLLVVDVRILIEAVIANPLVCSCRITAAKN